MNRITTKVYTIASLIFTAFPINHIHIPFLDTVLRSFSKVKFYENPFRKADRIAKGDIEIQAAPIIETIEEDIESEVFIDTRRDSEKSEYIARMQFEKGITNDTDMI